MMPATTPVIAAIMIRFFRSIPGRVLSCERGICLSFGSRAKETSHPDKETSQQGNKARKVRAGGRPSPGAEVSVKWRAMKFSERCGTFRVAAPEDGRTPPLGVANRLLASEREGRYVPRRLRSLPW